MADPLRILVVEDDPAWRRWLKEVFFKRLCQDVEQECDIQAAPSGDEAIAMIEEAVGERSFHIISLDLNLSRGTERDSDGNAAEGSIQCGEDLLIECAQRGLGFAWVVITAARHDEERESLEQKHSNSPVYTDNLSQSFNLMVNKIKRDFGIENRVWLMEKKPSTGPDGKTRTLPPKEHFKEFSDIVDIKDLRNVAFPSSGPGPSYALVVDERDTTRVLGTYDGQKFDGGKAPIAGVLALLFGNPRRKFTLYELNNLAAPGTLGPRPGSAGMRPQDVVDSQAGVRGGRGPSKKKSGLGTFLAEHLVVVELKQQTEKAWEGFQNWRAGEAKELARSWNSSKDLQCIDDLRNGFSKYLSELQDPLNSVSNMLERGEELIRDGDIQEENLPPVDDLEEARKWIERPSGQLAEIIAGLRKLKEMKSDERRAARINLTDFLVAAREVYSGARTRPGELVSDDTLKQYLTKPAMIRARLGFMGSDGQQHVLDQVKTERGPDGTEYCWYDPKIDVDWDLLADPVDLIPPKKREEILKAREERDAKKAKRRNE